MVVEGRAVDMRGEGVPAAKVHVVASKAPDDALARTGADGDGYFRLGKVPKERSLLVYAQADGYCVGTAYASPSSRVVKVELQHAATVRGTVRNGKGEPVADVIVRAAPNARTLTYVHCDARTDAEGKFVLPAVPLAPVRFSAWVPGEGLASALEHVTADVELALAPNNAATTRLDVKITGLPPGTPPIGLSLLPYGDGRLARLPPPHERPFVDADGHWSLDRVPDFDYTISPVSEAFAFAPRELRVKAGNGPHTLAFAATARGDAMLACRARVRGPDDKPVAGLPFAMRAANGGNVAEATTGDDGTLVFASPLAKGASAVIYTTHENWVVDQQKNAEHGKSDRRFLVWHETVVDPSQVLDLHVVPACKVFGRLLLADGRPAALVSLQLEEGSASRWPRWMSMSSTTTDREGNFRFVGRHHLADDVRVRVEAAAGFFTGEPFAIAEPGTERRLGELRMSAPASIDGVVRDAQQRPAAGVRVWLRDWDFSNNLQASGSVTETLTDRDGRYRFLGVPVGGAWLQLLPRADERGDNERAVKPFEVEAGKTYTFDLQVPPK